MKGIGFPNVGKEAPVKDWIQVLQRIKKLAKEINTIRVYEPPTCSVSFNSTCFEPFMREADRLGVYVMIAGSGTVFGYLPTNMGKCVPNTLQGCYQVGGLLGFGLTVLNNFNFPNTLAIAVANEIEQNIMALPVLKAYARDLKSHMKMCNVNKDSPTRGLMRHIPLVYAATDTGPTFANEADYLFCGDKHASIDIYGLNIERWVSDAGGRPQYNQVNKVVKAKRWPGAFVHSEEGGPYGKPFPAVPTWDQLPGFFGNWTGIDGFAAYCYWGGNARFNMFDGPSVNATELPDGKVFFKKIADIGADPVDEEPAAVITPDCNATIHIREKDYNMTDYRTIDWYDTGKNGYAVNCPKPWQSTNSSHIVVV